MYDNSNGINSLNFIKSFKGDSPCYSEGSLSSPGSSHACDCGLNLTGLESNSSRFTFTWLVSLSSWLTGAPPSSGLFSVGTSVNLVDAFRFLWRRMAKKEIAARMRTATGIVTPMAIFAAEESPPDCALPLVSAGAADPDADNPDADLEDFLV
jgi:hypothetical protein